MRESSEISSVAAQSGHAERALSGRIAMRTAIALVLLGFLPASATAQAPAQREQNPAQMLQQMEPPQLENWFGPNRLTNSLALFLLLTVLTLAPSILIMTTSFVRIVIVLSITRQALGTQNLPPNTVLTTLALFMTYHIMNPVMTEMYDKGVAPYSRGEINANQLVASTLKPLRDFMAQQIENTHNQDDIWLFVDFSPKIDPATIETYDDVPLSILLPAYMLSELRTAFMIGFQLFLPFLIIDMAISSILVSMGMMMLPPVLISLPFKLLLFVLVDGWTLIAEMLMVSFSPLEPLPTSGSG